MPNDLVQIGPLSISKVAFDFLAVIIAVITGGLITYLTTRRIESQKWEQQKKDKQQEQYREALALALEWIRPIDYALIHVVSLSQALVWRHVTNAEFSERWPRLLRDLSKIDRRIPARLRVLLPNAVYDGAEIVKQIDELRTYLMSTEAAWEDRTEAEAAMLERIKEVSHRLDAIEKLSDDYKEMLVAEYKKTYE